MPICPECGVFIENDQRRCPLCGTFLAAADKEKHAEKAPVSREESVEEAGIETEREEKVRLLFGEINGFIALAGALVVFAVDYAYGMAITWSRYPLTAIAFAWLLLNIPVWLRRRGYLIVGAETINLVLFLYLLNLYTGNSVWFTGLGLPIAAGLGVGILLAMGCIRLFRPSVLGSISVVLLILGVYLLWLEMVINQYLQGATYVSWSLIAASSVIPIIIFFFFFDVRLKRHGSNLKKHFHV